MAFLTKEYMQSKDIDWFFNLNGVSIHVASAGSILPEVINDGETLERIQSEVANLPITHDGEEIIYNDRFFQTYLQNLEGEYQEYQEEIRYPEYISIEERIERYRDSFREMTKRGFISLDRTNIDDPYDLTFHWVCRPLRPRLVRGIDIPHFENNVQLDNILSQNTFRLYELMGWVRY